MRPCASIGPSSEPVSSNIAPSAKPTTLAQAVQFCYDSPTFPDTSAQTGANTCGFFSRGTDFQIQNGFGSGFINLAATELRALNISGTYAFNLPADIGRFTLRGNGYHLINYRDSAAGDFSDAQESAGTFNRPQWEVQVSGRVETKGGFFTQLTWNWRDRTRLFSSGLPATIEVATPEFLVYPRQSLFDVVVGADINERFRLQLVVNNITDNNYAGNLGFFNGGYLDQIGRRFQLSANAKF